METQELRRGNYIDRNGLMKVWAISPMRIKIYDCVNKCLIDHMFFISTFNPIPLSEEWLLKFGWKNKKTNFYLEICGFTILFESTGNTLSCFLEGIGIDILYVHQLQNLYFALTGTELEMK